MQVLQYVMVKKAGTDSPFTKLLLEGTRTSNGAVPILHGPGNSGKVQDAETAHRRKTNP